MNQASDPGTNPEQAATEETKEAEPKASDPGTKPGQAEIADKTLTSPIPRKSTLAESRKDVEKSQVNPKQNPSGVSGDASKSPYMKQASNHTILLKKLERDLGNKYSSDVVADMIKIVEGHPSERSEKYNDLRCKLMNKKLSGNEMKELILELGKHDQADLVTTAKRFPKNLNVNKPDDPYTLLLKNGGISSFCVSVQQVDENKNKFGNKFYLYPFSPYPERFLRKQRTFQSAHKKGSFGKKGVEREQAYRHFCSRFVKQAEGTLESEPELATLFDSKRGPVWSLQVVLCHNQTNGGKQKPTCKNDTSGRNAGYFVCKFCNFMFCKDCKGGESEFSPNEVGNMYCKDCKDQADPTVEKDTEGDDNQDFGTNEYVFLCFEVFLNF